MEGIDCYATHPGGYAQEFRRRGERRFLFIVIWKFTPQHLAQVFALDEEAYRKNIWQIFLKATDDERNSR